MTDLQAAREGMELVEAELDRRWDGEQPDDRYDPILDSLADLRDEVTVA